MAAKPKRKPVDEPAVVPAVQEPADAMARLAGRFREVLKLTDQTPDAQVFNEAIERLEASRDDYRTAFEGTSKCRNTAANYPR